ncbi:hypothetical protein GCM10009682_60560 [Luedemannella flava]|uniref:Uncharacterized protein n=1 Tax=Luedemannella flava TaxID=349316 RepID=A0ABP4YXR3_9ACTN
MAGLQPPPPRHRMSEGARRVVLALYPPVVRERYGDEIADLLTASQRPWRDLADTAWCGLTERVTTVGPTELRATGRHLWTTVRTTLLVALSLAVLLALLMVIPFAAVPLAALLGWLAGRRLRPWWLPVTLGVGLAVAALTGMPEAFGGGLGSPGARAFLAIGLGGTVAVALLTAGLAGVTRLSDPARRWLVAVVCVVGALTTVELASITYVLGHFTPAEAPRGHALQWYLSAMTPLPMNLGGVRPDDPDRLGAGFHVPDALEALPGLVSVVLAFVAAGTYAARRKAVDDMVTASRR